MRMPTAAENFVAQMRCQTEMTIWNDAGLIIVRASIYAAVQATWQHFQHAIHL